MRYLLVAILLFQIGVSTALAQTDTSSFFIRVFGGADTQSPTTPVLTSALPVSLNQVDITWSTASDNHMLSGYVLFRGGVAIATTTLTSFSDTGLTASTSYSYFVRAFDGAFNYSSSSNAIIAITLSQAIPSVERSDAGGTATKVVLNNLIVTPSQSSAVLLAQVARPARFEIRWGRSGSYELGYTVNDVFTRSYKTTLTGLVPNTRYQYEVIGYTIRGTATVLKRGNFMTLGAPDFSVPANVSQLTAIVSGRDVALRWNPPPEDYKQVRMVRNHLRFPAHLEDGVVIYQGTETSLTDRDALKDNSPVYYTVFVIDTVGNVSSGAVARVYYIDENAIASAGPAQPPLHNGGLTHGQPSQSASTSPNVSPETKIPTLDDIFLRQKNQEQSFAYSEVILDAETSFLISIPKAAVSENLKTIIASLTDPSDSRQSYSFILRLNKDNTAYEAVLSALNMEGQSRMIVDIYDYESLVVATYQKTILFKRFEHIQPTVFPDLFIKKILTAAPFAAVGLVLFLLLFILLRSGRKSL